MEHGYFPGDGQAEAEAAWLVRDAGQQQAREIERLAATASIFCPLAAATLMIVCSA
jgi:hypothetical protein